MEQTPATDRKPATTRMVVTERSKAGSKIKYS
jgi:hypothetical protein